LIFTQINAQNYSVEAALKLATTMKEMELLSEKGEKIFKEIIQNKQLGSANFPDIISGNRPMIDSLKASNVLGFLSEAFNGELAFRTHMPNMEEFQTEIVKLGINEASTEDEIKAAIAKLAPKFEELKGFMIEYAIKGEVNSPPRIGATMPFGFRRQRAQELIHPKRSVLGKHIYKTLTDLQKIGLINERIYQDVLAEIKSGRLFMENLVVNHAFERSKYYEDYDRKQARELAFLDSLEKYELITATNKISLINSYEPFELKGKFEILPYCNQAKIIQVPNKEKSPAEVYEAYFQTIKTLLPNFEYSNFQFKIDRQIAKLIRSNFFTIIIN